MTKNGVSWPSVNRRMPYASRSHWILGDPSSNRFANYTAAALRLGMPAPRCIDWADVINQGVQVFDRIPRQSRLRIDSFGQRDEVIAALIAHGDGTSFPQRGEILAIDHQYAGLCRVLREVSDWAASRPDVQLDQSPTEIETMFDKWATHQRMLPHRPESTLLPHDLASLNRTLRRWMKDRAGRVFVKPRFASSASGVCCYRVFKQRHQLIAPLEIVRRSGHIQLFNSLRIRSYTDLGDIQDIFGVLAPQGMMAEASVNKARVNGDRFDLRIVVIDGHADHIVARQSAWPITNLHLGNQRASWQSVAAAVGVGRLNACRELALQAASRFPQTLCCGVDVLLPRRGSPLVCEVNAFGDFLPNLAAAGRSVYEAILLAGDRQAEALSC